MHTLSSRATSAMRIGLCQSGPTSDGSLGLVPGHGLRFCAGSSSLPEARSLGFLDHVCEESLTVIQLV